MKKIILSLFTLFVLIGNSAAAEKLNKTEKDKIDELIEFISSSEVTFIRNGSEYSSSLAAKHINFKMGFAGNRIKWHEPFFTAHFFYAFILKKRISGNIECVGII